MIETPKKRIFPSCFSFAIASAQLPSPTHSSDQTWNCWTSIVSRPRLRRLSSVFWTIQSPGNASSAVTPGGAGHLPFFGGTFVATYTVSAASLTAAPTSSSLCPSP